MGNYNNIAVHQVKNHLLNELDKCNQARIKAIKENKIDSEIKMWGDMQIIYSNLINYMDEKTHGFNRVDESPQIF